MDENKIAIQAFTKLDQFLDGALDSELKSAIRKRSIIGGLCMAIPLWGIETIVYMAVLWGTYKEVSRISTVPFKDHLWENIGGAIVLNILIGVVSGIILDMIPVVGWVVQFVIGFASITISGMAYIKVLKALHGSKAKADLNVKQGFASMKTGGSSLSQETRASISRIGQFVDDAQPLIGSHPVNDRHLIQESTKESSDSFASRTQQLLDLKSLLDAGILTQEEFDAQKKLILNR